MAIKEIIETLDLEPHPEGGFYKEVYRSSESFNTGRGLRAASTSIYFLLEKGDFSAFHKIKSDETWHFYKGGVLLVYILHDNGSLEVVRLGTDYEKGEVSQFTVPADVWFASIPAEETEYSLVGCTVSPGFDFEDFEMATQQSLLTQFPEQEAIIKKLTRD